MIGQPVDTLEATALALVAPGKGILAADESNPTIEKRFRAVGVDSTEVTRRITTPGVEAFVSGVILFDETMRQPADDGNRVPSRGGGRSAGPRRPAPRRSVMSPRPCRGEPRRSGRPSVTSPRRSSARSASPRRGRDRPPTGVVRGQGAAVSARPTTSVPTGAPTCRATTVHLTVKRKNTGLSVPASDS